MKNYKGDVNKLGADTGYLASGVMRWTVFAPANISASGAVAGHYAAANASATVGVGGAVHVLAGGLNGSITLQPVAIEGNTGLDVGAGVETKNLRWRGRSSRGLEPF